ncbi:MAG: RcnB family protein [Burkholderiales bacterium]
MYRKTALVFLFAALTAAPVCADPPAWAGGGKGKHGKGHARAETAHANRDGSNMELGRHLSERHHVIVRAYYDEEFRRGKCPRGLAKKNNGCMPPGQAKYWHVGQTLPRRTVYYEVPPALIVQLPRPSPGHQYVRVATDILLIAVGSGMVVDAVRDLGRM